MTRRFFALARPRVHHEALDWARRVVTNGGSVSQPTLRAVSAFCDAIERAGIRDRFVRMSPMCGTGLEAMLVPLFRATSFSGAVVGNTTDTNGGGFTITDYTANDGLLGGGGKRLQTGVTPDAVGSTGHLHLSLKGKTLASDGTDSIGIGSHNSGATQRYVLGVSISSNFVAGGITDYMTRGWWGSNATTQHTTSGAAVLAGGQYMMNRSSGTRTDIYLNGTSVANLTTSVTPGANANEMWVMANNNNGTAQFSGTIVCRGYSIGLSMDATQAAAYSTAMAALNTALGRTA